MIEFFINQYKNATLTQILLESMAFVFGIISVFCAKKQNIWVYPSGIVSTIITIYLMYQASYFGDMTMNFYYTIMSVYGWYLWSKKIAQPNLEISRTTSREKINGFGLFILTMIFTYFVYVFFNTKLEFLNYIDIFTSGLFFTAMWFMAKKKIENWLLWIFADFIAVPLFAYRGLGMIALQYFIFTILAILAYIEWNKILVQKN